MKSWEDEVKQDWLSEGWTHTKVVYAACPVPRLTELYGECFSPNFVRCHGNFMWFYLFVCVLPHRDITAIEGNVAFTGAFWQLAIYLLQPHWIEVYPFQKPSFRFLLVFFPPNFKRFSLSPPYIPFSFVPLFKPIQIRISRNISTFLPYLVSLHRNC